MDCLAKARLGSLARVSSNNTYLEGLIVARTGDPYGEQVPGEFGGVLSLTLEAMPMIRDGSIFLPYPVGCPLPKGSLSGVLCMYGP